SNFDANIKMKFSYKSSTCVIVWASGATDNAPDYGSGDSRSNFDANIKMKFSYKSSTCVIVWASGATDNAPDYGSGDSRFESWLARCVLRELEIF
ncbi:hypothetical protein NPIL_594181, partial [Nephila pilipes]